MPDQWGILTFKLTEDAARRLNEALRYAEARLHHHAEAPHGEDLQAVEDHAEWLRWGMGRIDEARRRARDHRETGQ